MPAVLNMSQITTRVRDCFSMSRICGFTSKQECDYINAHLWAELNRTYKNGRAVYSTYLRGFAAGLIESERFANYRWYLEFCYVGPDGTKYSTRKGAARTTQEFYDSGRGVELCDMPSGHYWIESGKPYFVSGGAENA
jgi:hypothetical protein